MKNLLYKEFHLVIHPLFYLVILSGGLLMIPQWAYFIAMMYFFFITVLNIFSIGKAQNDIGFSAMLPVRRNDIVKARVVSVIILEVLQIVVTAVFAVINLSVYHFDNYLMNTNAAFIGFVFIMYALFNLALFPMFYKTAYKIGIPIIVAMGVAVLFSAGVEFLTMIPPFTVLHGRQINAAQIGVLAGGIVLFALINMAAYRLSVKRFESIDL